MNDQRHGTPPHHPSSTRTVGDPTVLLCMINSIRTSRGAKPLGLSDKLVASCRAHSRDQAEMNRVTTTGSDGSGPSSRAERAGFNYQYLGELVGGGYRNEDELLKAFMADGRMRDHILNQEVRQFGSGLARNKKDYPYWTLDFGADWTNTVNLPDCQGAMPALHVPGPAAPIATEDGAERKSAASPFEPRSRPTGA